MSVPAQCQSRTNVKMQIPSENGSKLTAIDDLANHIINRLQATPPSQRLLVGIAGIPASGKSTFALALTNHLNTLLPSLSSRAVLVGLDGWHLTRAQLDDFPDPILAHARRGAHWTFDPHSYIAFLRSIRGPIPTLPSEQVIAAPSFDHAVKDPTPSAIHIASDHRVVILEGLYTFLSIEPWISAAELLDERVWIDIDIPRATERLIKRHVLTGVAKDMKEAIWRAEENDTPNGRFIIENKLDPTRVIPSVDDPNLLN